MIKKMTVALAMTLTLISFGSFASAETVTQDVISTPTLDDNISLTAGGISWWWE